ncbi:MAG: CPBP family intramembrane glutamic endopeptidase [Myxococcota bacterium]
MPRWQHFDTSGPLLPSLRRITTLAAFIYVPLALLAVVWATIGQGRDVWSLANPWLEAPYGTRLGISLALGIALGILVVRSTPFVLARFAWAQALHAELAPLVRDLSSTQVTWLAVLSGVGEELFFRGAMQPVFGLWLTSLIFGALHVGPRRVFLAWGAWAFVMGVLLGALFALTGLVWGSIFAHVWINQRNFRFIQRG